MNKNIFVPAVGQHENIGDVVLRRPLLNWLRQSGVLHVYVGSSSKGYDAGLMLNNNDVIYHSFLKWFFNAIKSSLLGSAHYAFKPGEIQMSLLGLKEHLLMLPIILMIRLYGNKVIRVGSGARNYSKIPLFLMTPSIYLCNIVKWRDPKTTAYIGFGQTMPDLAFAEGDAAKDFLSTEKRRVLVLSMRGDREDHSDIWINAVKKYAEIHELEIWIVTQVLRDANLSTKLAAKLNCKLLNWNGSNHDEQERILRELYKQTHTVVSDRLHVLITAFTHGAAPVGILTYASDKIERHFAAINIDDVAVYVKSKSTNQIVDEMDLIYANNSAKIAKLISARGELDKLKSDILEVLSK